MGEKKKKSLKVKKEFAWWVPIDRDAMGYLTCLVFIICLLGMNDRRYSYSTSCQSYKPLGKCPLRVQKKPLKIFISLLNNLNKC